MSRKKVEQDPPALVDADDAIGGGDDGNDDEEVDIVVTKGDKTRENDPFCRWSNKKALIGGSIVALIVIIAIAIGAGLGTRKSNADTSAASSSGSAADAMGNKIAVGGLSMKLQGISAGPIDESAIAAFEQGYCDHVKEYFATAKTSKYDESKSTSLQDAIDVTDCAIYVERSRLLDQQARRRSRKLLDVATPSSIGIGIDIFYSEMLTYTAPPEFTFSDRDIILEPFNTLAAKLEFVEHLQISPLTTAFQDLTGVGDVVYPPLSDTCPVPSPLPNDLDASSSSAVCALCPKGWLLNPDMAKATPLQAYANEIAAALAQTGQSDLIPAVMQFVKCSCAQIEYVLTSDELNVMLAEKEELDEACDMLQSFLGRGICCIDKDVEEEQDAEGTTSIMQKGDDTELPISDGASLPTDIPEFPSDEDAWDDCILNDVGCDKIREQLESNLAQLNAACIAEDTVQGKRPYLIELVNYVVNYMVEELLEDEPISEYSICDSFLDEDVTWIKFLSEDGEIVPYDLVLELDRTYRMHAMLVSRSKRVGTDDMMFGLLPKGGSADYAASYNENAKQWDINIVGKEIGNVEFSAAVQVGDRPSGHLMGDLYPKVCCNKNECCDKPGEACCGQKKVCCTSEETCCGDTCCKEDKCCGNVCCKAGEVCCGNICCEAGVECCNGKCCSMRGSDGLLDRCCEGECISPRTCCPKCKEDERCCNAYPPSKASCIPDNVYDREQHTYTEWYACCGGSKQDKFYCHRPHRCCCDEKSRAPIPYNPGFCECCGPDESCCYEFGCLPNPSHATEGEPVCCGSRLGQYDHCWLCPFLGDHVNTGKPMESCCKGPIFDELECPEFEYESETYGPIYTCKP